MRRPGSDRTFQEAFIGFGRKCRDSGLPITTGQIADLCTAIGSFDIGNRDEVYAAARCLLLSRHADEPHFRAIFDRYWLRAIDRDISDVERDLQSDLRRQSRGDQGAEPPQDSIQARERTQIALDSPEGEPTDENDDMEDGAHVAAYSITEVLRHKDFAQLSPDEITRVRRLIAELRYETPTRKMRRTKRSSKGARLDPRRALRENLSRGGELVVLPRRTPRRQPRPLVLLCDISGSMERYTGILLEFLHAVRQGRELVETFVFGTRLTRITRQLRIRDTDAALAAVAGEVNDWGGGTRIGESLGAFNRRWARRVLGHDATVVVISDGWDRGEPTMLAGEMAHLQRLSHRLIWLNPLLGLEGYAPLTRGIRAALPYVDDFLASHNLASLEQLAEFLRRVDDHRPERRQRGTAGT